MYFTTLVDYVPPSSNLCNTTTFLHEVENEPRVAGNFVIVTVDKSVAAGNVTRLLPPYFDGVQSAAHFPIVKWPQKCGHSGFPIRRARRPRPNLVHIIALGRRRRGPVSQHVVTSWLVFCFSDSDSSCFPCAWSLTLADAATRNRSVLFKL